MPNPRPEARDVNPIRHPRALAAGLLVCVGASSLSAQDPVLLPTAVAPAEPLAASSSCGSFDFTSVPPVQPFPRQGFFPIPPSGCGSYSLLDAARGVVTNGPRKFGYPPFGLMAPSFFNADWRYLDDPKTPPRDWLDEGKRVPVGDHWLASTGGSAWARSMNEYNSRLGQTDNEYLLTRARAYVDVWYEDRFRVFVEGITAYSSWQDLPRLPIDENKLDLLNAFVDLKVGEVNDKPVYVRAGRQELLFGSQRLVSTLDWANTRRTFQGVSGFVTGDKWDAELFWVQPVVPNSNRFDSVDNNQNFAGAWVTYKPKKGTTADLYYLMLDNTNNVTQQRIVRAPFTRHTFGARTAGDLDNEILWDLEAALQLGTQGRRDVVAGMATAGLGYHFKDTAGNPTVWAYYDYASGDGTPNTGNQTTFHQLFPFGHYYMGWADLVARQNIHDVNFHLYLYPAKWATVWVQYHNYWLANRRDALYNAAGNATRRDATGAAGSHVGNEIDAVVNLHLTPRSDLLVGYSHLYGGEFLKRTSGPLTAPSASVAFIQFGVRW
jgi:hypothetical protein